MSTPSRLSDLNHIESSDVRIYHRNIIRTPIKIKNFDERNKIESFNILVINKTYGTQCNLYMKQKDCYKLHSNCYLYLDQENTGQLNVVTNTLKGSKIISKDFYQLILIKIQEIQIVQDSNQIQQLKNKPVLMITYNISYQQNENYYLLFENQHILNLFTQGLQNQIIYEQYTLQFNNQVQFLETQIQTILNQSNEFLLSSQDIQKVFSILGFHISQQNIVKMFFNNSDYQQITLKQFKQLLPELFHSFETTSVFTKYSEFFTIIKDPQVGCMKIDEFKKFLKEVQHETEDSQSFINQLNQITRQNEQTAYQLISQDQFTSFLLNRNNLIIDDSKTQIYQDMNQPIGNYFINCSRTTMQLDVHIPSIQKMNKYIKLQKGSYPILFAIESGCRYIEINIWDGPNGKPICYYGPMMNFCVSLVFLFQIIKDYAFKYSKFPFIVFLNDHCTKNQKKLIVPLIEDTIGPMLAYKNLNKDELGSPDGLQYKVLLCNKIIMKSNAYKHQQEEGNYDHESEEIYQASKESNINQFQKISSQISQYRPRGSVEGTNNTEQKQSIKQLQNINSNNNKRQEGGKVLEELDEPLDNCFYFHEIIQEGLVILDHQEFIYSVGDWVQLKGVRTSQRKNSKKLSHNKYLRQRQSDGSVQASQDTDQMIQQQQQNQDILNKFMQNPIMYVQKYSKQGKIFKYSPSCKQTDTENSYASQGFLSGSSLIMMHPHKIDYNYMYYHAKFMENGGKYSGYLLKSQFQKFNDKNILYYQNQNYMVKVNVICGYHLESKKYQSGCTPILQVLVRYPRNGQEDYYEQYTSQMQEDSFNPQFNLNCEFTIKSLELSVIMFIIYHEQGDNLVCWNAFPFSIIKQGYRVIPLQDDLNNDLENSFLLAQIQIL